MILEMLLNTPHMMQVGGMFLTWKLNDILLFSDGPLAPNLSGEGKYRLSEDAL